MNQNRLFLGCFVSLIATAFAFMVRASVLSELATEFELSSEQVGYIGVGAGLYPFAISIILLSLVIDKIGYGRAMVFAFLAHLISTVLMIFANSFQMLYWATFLFALANGTVEAVINPVVATVYSKNKTHWLNILHAGWPGGLVLAGLLSIVVSLAVGMFVGESADGTPVYTWRYQMVLLLLPTLLYGFLLFGQKFPVQERVSAGVSYMEMLKEFGTASCVIVCFLLAAGVDQILLTQSTPEKPMSLSIALDLQGTIESASETIPEGVAKMIMYLGLALIPSIVFGAIVRTFGRFMFVFLLLVMLLLATTELGTDGWIPDIVGTITANPLVGTLALVYTSLIMFVLRFFAGPIVHRISPLGLLAVCAGIATAGLLWLSNAGTALSILFLAATLYGVGKTFFWPTTLGVVSEQYPKGGALMLNAIAGVGMLAVGTLGGPLIGTVQDRSLESQLLAEDPELHEQIMVEKAGLLGQYNSADASRVPEDQKPQFDEMLIEAKQSTLGKIAVLPAIMFVGYMGLIFYFRSKGGYKAEVLTGHAADDEEFTGGTEGPGEA